MIYAARNRRSPAVVGDAFGYCLQGAAGWLARIAGLSVGNWARKEEEEVLKMTFSNGDVAVYLSKI